MFKLLTDKMINRIVDAQTKNLWGEIQNLRTQLDTYDKDLRDYLSSDPSGDVLSRYLGADIITKGKILTPGIVDIRTHFTLGDGLELTTIEDATYREEAWLEEFNRYNAISDTFSIDVQKQIELEGKVLVIFLWDSEYKWEWTSEGERSPKINSEKGMVAVRILTQKSFPYNVVPNETDYETIEKVKFLNGKKSDINAGEFEYMRNPGVIDNPNSYRVPLKPCIKIIDNIENALDDLRKNNRLFGVAKPGLQCESKQQATEMHELMKDIKFRESSVFIHLGIFKYYVPDEAGAKSILDELLMNIRILSGQASIPLHLMGFPSEMSNRATAEDMTTELINAGYAGLRKRSETFFSSLLRKAAAFQSKNDRLTALRNNVFGAKIHNITASTWKRIVDVFLPLSVDGKISDKTLLEHIPGVNVREEENRMAVQNENNLSIALAAEHRYPQGVQSQEQEGE